jgi:hypothetical protein
MSAIWLDEHYFEDLTFSITVNPTVESVELFEPQGKDFEDESRERSGLEGTG